MAGEDQCLHTLGNEAGRQHRHAALLGHDAAEVLGKADRSSEDPDIGGECGEQRSKPAKPGKTAGITGGDEQQTVGDPVGEFVIDRPAPGFLAALNCDHAVEQVAD